MGTRSARLELADEWSVRRQANPHRPGISRALGLRAGGDDPFIVSQTAFAEDSRIEALRRLGEKIMSLTNVWNRMMRISGSSRRRKSNRQRALARQLFLPRLEILEDRT